MTCRPPSPPRCRPAGPEPRRRRSAAAPASSKPVLAPILFVSVNAVLFVVFFVWPAVIGLGYSFTDYNGVVDPKFVGLANYFELFADDTFYAALGRTFLYAIVAVPLGFVLSLSMALMLTSPAAKGRSVARIVFFVPWLISPIVTGVIWRWMFGENFGLANFVIESLGGKAVPWQSNADLSLLVVVFATAWAGAAFNMLLFVAAIRNVPQSYYEAASLDGAGAWHQFRYITLPSIAPTSFIVILLSSLSAFKEFATVQALNGGGPGTDNNLLVQYIYTNGFQNAHIGYARRGVDGPHAHPHGHRADPAGREPPDGVPSMTATLPTETDKTGSGRRARSLRLRPLRPLWPALAALAAPAAPAARGCGHHAASPGHRRHGPALGVHHRVPGFPVLWFVLSAFKPGGELFSCPLTLLPKNWSVEGLRRGVVQLRLRPVLRQHRDRRPGHHGADGPGECGHRVRAGEVRQPVAEGVLRLHPRHDDAPHRGDPRSDVHRHP
ncbi:sugar ABC transporter permease [Curtobacterium flaccumfaciens]|nr:sugar ABC transporter permease [Curtobacterium flaccumfaciens]